MNKCVGTLSLLGCIRMLPSTACAESDSYVIKTDKQKSKTYF